MTKKFTYLGMLFLFFGATAFVVLRYNGKLKNQVNAFYPLKERKGLLAQAPEWASVKKAGDKLIRVVRETPTDTRSVLGLATLYIQEARATGDYAYYNPAALHYVNAVLETEPDNFEALMLKAVLQLSDHHFAEGLQTAEKAKTINPYNAYVYGLITDGNVELGRYEAAVQNLDKMVSIRPDLRSYSRISYLREINGDLPGAIEAMKEAVKAGMPGDESTEWARTQLAHLFERTGDATAAEQLYRSSLDVRPGYAPALAGLANLSLAKNDFAKAIDFYNQAIAAQPDFGFREGLAKAYLLSGQKEKSEELINNLVSELTTASAAGESASNHHADLELAWAFELKGDFKKALNHALNEYGRRPENIDAAETVAWCRYKNGEAAAALPYLQKAMRTGSKNPALLLRAGIIHAAAGDKAKAKATLQETLQVNPVVDPLLKREAQAAVRQF